MLVQWHLDVKGFKTVSLLFFGKKIFNKKILIFRLIETTRDSDIN